MSELIWDSSSLRYNIEKKEICDKLHEKLPPGICPAPFTTLIVNPDGRVGFCRERSNDDVVGNIKEESLWDIWNGEKLRKIRREFLEGKIVTCKKQIKDRRCNNQCFNQVILPYAKFTEFQEAPPLRFSPDFNGECNLRCMTCNIWKLPNGLYDEIGFWDMAKEKLFPKLKVLDPLAGEPFIQKDFYRLIDLMSNLNPDCAWRFTTNAHWKFTPKIKEHLDKIKHIYGFIISVDAATPETYAKVRSPGNIHIVWETTQKIIEYRNERVQTRGPDQKFGITVAMALHKGNWHEAPQFMRWGHSLGIEPALQGVYFPEEISIFKIEDIEERKKIIEYYIQEMDYKDLIHIYRVFTPLISSLGKELDYQYRKAIVDKYFSIKLTSDDLWFCAQDFPELLNSFEEKEQMSLAKRIIQHSLNNFPSEYFSRGRMLFDYLKKYLTTDEVKRFETHLKLLKITSHLLQDT